MNTRLNERQLAARPEVSCEFCGAVFAVKPYRINTARYCSASCKSTHVARTTAEKRGNAQRNRGDGKSYRKLNGRHEHRVIAEQKIGWPLMPGEIVHHIDGDHRNNDPDNLAVMTQGEHMREHGLGIPGMALPWEPWKYRRS